MNKGQRRLGRGIRRRKLKRTTENCAGGWGGRERGGDITGIQLNKNIDVTDVPDLEEMIQLTGCCSCKYKARFAKKPRWKFVI